MALWTRLHKENASTPSLCPGQYCVLKSTITITIISFTHNSFTVTCSSLLVLAAEEQPVPLLLQLLRGGTLLRAAGHLLHRLRGARLALLPYPVPRLFGWLTDRSKNALSLLDLTHWIRDTVHVKLLHSLQCTCNARLGRIRCSP